MRRFHLFLALLLTHTWAAASGIRDVDVGSTHVRYLVQSLWGATPFLSFGPIVFKGVLADDPQYSAGIESALKAGGYVVGDRGIALKVVETFAGRASRCPGASAGITQRPNGLMLLGTGVVAVVAAAIGGFSGSQVGAAGVLNTVNDIGGMVRESFGASGSENAMPGACFGMSFDGTRSDPLLVIVTVCHERECFWSEASSSDPAATLEQLRQINLTHGLIPALNIGAVPGGVTSQAKGGVP